MRNLAMGLIYNFKSNILEAARYLRDHEPALDSVIDTAKVGAVEILRDFRKELEVYPTFRLSRPDIQAVGRSLLENIGPYDPQYKDGRVDTGLGNESLTLQVGVVVASLIANKKMLRIVRYHSEPVALYLQ
ncbi:MAG: hypothetical protein AABX59_03895, partial [Nanoarchaeota archaeon]